MSLPELISLALTALLAENFVLVRFLGVRPFLEGSKKTVPALIMGLSVVFVMGLSSMVAWLVNRFLLVPLHLEVMRTVAFILVIALLVQLVELVLKKFLPALHAVLGVYLPLLTTNCAVLGAVLLNVQSERGFLASIAFGVFSGLGFTLAAVLFAQVRERLEYARFPKCFEGFPQALIAAGLLAMVFTGFSGLQVVW